MPAPVPACAARALAHAAARGDFRVPGAGTGRAFARGMRGCAAAIVASILLAGCGGQSIATGAAADAGAPPFPTGTYTSCAQGLRDDMLDIAGFEQGATLDVVQHGSTLIATYVDQNGSTNALAFAPATSTSATLAGEAQVSAGFSVDCVQGVGAMGTYPAVLDATAGALTYSAGTVFLTLTGTVHGDAGPCGPTSMPATFWVVGAGGPAVEPAATAPPPSPTGLSGTYACTSQVETEYASGGSKDFVAGGGPGGQLTLTRTGATLSAHYSGDTALAGTLHLDLATATTATAAGQDLTTLCDVPIGTPGALKPGTQSVAAASLTAVGPTLFLSFSGTMDAGSACAGARKAGSAICTKQ